MRRSTRVFGSRIRLTTICTGVLLSLTIPLWADVTSAASPPGEGANAWSHADLTGLDQQVQQLLRRPMPAKLTETSAEAATDKLGSLDGVMLVGPSTRPSPTLNPATASPTSPLTSSSASLTPTPMPASTEGADEVFGEVFGDGSAATPEAAPAAEVSSDEATAEQAPPPAPAPETRMAEHALRSEPIPVPAQIPTRTIPPHVAPLRVMIEQCLQVHANQRLNSAEDSCWSMMHAFLGWGPSCQIHIGGPRGRRANAMVWVGHNQPCGGRRLFYLEGNRIRGREGPGYQGHPAQFLAMMAQCNIDPSFQMRVNDRYFTLANLIEEEQRTCTSTSELTFKLIGLTHYLGTEAAWTSDNGEPWDIHKILGVELSQPVNGAACGGTHRLMGISYALAKRRQEGGGMDGNWGRAETYIADYHRYTLTLQNRDGSFSSDWFRQRADWGDMNRRVQTTGHMLEWLVFSLPDEMLFDPRVIGAVHYLTRTLTQHRFHEWEVGPKGHAIRALRLYHQRVFEPVERVETPMAERMQRAGRSS